MTEMVHWKNLRPASWRTVHILRPDRRTLIDSLLDYGWLYPVIARSRDGLLIDGFARWQILQSEKKVEAATKGHLPVHWVDCDEVDAALMHVRLNRGRGEIVPVRLSALLNTALRSGKYTEEQLRQALRMSYDEFDVLLAGTVLKTRKIDEHEYSRAWVPIEAPPIGATVVQGISIERPPNRDR